MPFVSSVSKFVLTVNKIATLPRPATRKRVLPPWEPDMCNGFQQEDISNAFFSLGNSQIPEIEKHGGDWVKLANCMKTKTVGSVNITCGTCRGGNPMSSDAGYNSLQVCLDTSSRDFLANWLVVEVVHLCGGTDLDAWAVKNWLFNVSKGGPQYAYFPLLPSEKELMCAGGTLLPGTGTYLWGKFTIWDPSTGDLWPSTRDAAGKIVPFGTSLIPFNVTYWEHVC